jgi:hypothetical protein
MSFGPLTGKCIFFFLLYFFCVIHIYIYITFKKRYYFILFFISLFFFYFRFRYGYDWEGYRLSTLLSSPKANEGTDSFNENYLTERDYSHVYFHDYV